MASKGLGHIWRMMPDGPRPDKHHSPDGRRSDDHHSRDNSAERQNPNTKRVVSPGYFETTIPNRLPNTLTMDRIVAYKPNQEGVAILAMNNGQFNVLDSAAATDLACRLERLEASKDCKGVIIKPFQQSSKAFSVGFDLNEFINFKDESRLRSYLSAVMDLWFKIYSTRLVTVAVVDGLAVGGGGVLAACCDRRVVSATTGVIGFNEVRMGIVLPVWVSDRLIELMGHQKAEYAMTAGLLMKARDAGDCGLVDRLVTKEKSLDAAVEEIRQFLRNQTDASSSPLKLNIRRSIIQKYKLERNTILDEMVKHIALPQTQTCLRQVMENKRSLLKYTREDWYD